MFFLLLWLRVLHAGFDEGLSKELSLFSSYAYTTGMAGLQKCLPTSPHTSGYTAYSYRTSSCPAFWGSETCAYITAYNKNQRRIVVSFQGTTDKNQLVAEILPLLESIGNMDYKTPYGFVSSYWMKGFNAMHKQLSADIQSLKSICSGCAFYVTGHSLGGTLAALSAVELDSELSTRAVYTFGQPRVGDSDYASKINSVVREYYRVVRANDVVPHVPPCHTSTSELVLSGTSNDPCQPGIQAPFHSNTEIFYTDLSMPSGGYKVCPEAEDLDCCDKYGSYPWDYSVNAHYTYYGVNLGTWGGSACTHNTDSTHTNRTKAMT